MIQMPVGMFPPEKTRWVQLALEKLMISGTITRKEMNTPAFQRKIGNLYDQSVDARMNKSYINKLVLENSSGRRKKIPETPNSSPTRQKQKFGRSTTSTSKSSTPTMSNTPRSSRSSPRFSSAGSFDEESEMLQRKVSDTLLQMLLKGMVSQDDQNKNNVGGSTPFGFMLAKENRSISTNTELDEDLDDWSWMAKASTKFKKGKSVINNTVADLTTPWIRPSPSVESFQDIKNCFIFEGKVCPMEATKKPTSSFAPLIQSRRRLQPSESGYFRKLADVRGFEPEEINVKYSKSRIFIEAKQAAADDRNYRVVREIIVLPRGLGINGLKVMRGKNNGRLVFEEYSHEKVLNMEKELAN